ncbi:MAG: dTMP kinase [Elusimicrobia bacterium RIFCSPLOWO2_01_FULL_64_13]|nr:MAG: dTMP kinase [Elusimicrobia bacterium RIFCSPHIGHO2_01_FULL_64_10]OGR97883.1 MAG: dTMP kinase [Elusimicrobia bacterium RIFCSPLOWO2_01_FULL_64_13]
MKRGFFITLDGPDGCGKTTQAGKLVRALSRMGCRPLHTREPGGTVFAERLRDLLLDSRQRIAPMTELFLYEAGRAQHVRDVLAPALRRGRVVVCERFTDATTAYQGYGRKLDLDMVRDMNAAASLGIVPDLTLVLDLPARTGLARARRPGKNDRMENETMDFHRRVRQGYLALARAHPERIRVIPALGSPGAVHRRVLAAVAARLGKACGRRALRTG